MSGSATPGPEHLDPGWLLIPHLVSSAEAASISERCDELLAIPAAERLAGDRVAGGTLHLTELGQRIPLVSEIVVRAPLATAIHDLLGPEAVVAQVSWRSPQPGFGGQRLHADDPPKMDDGPATVATAIIALVDFTVENGPTRVVPGSHRRPDLQRQSGSLEHHADEELLLGPAGSGFVFSGHLLHSGTINRSDAARPALQLLWRRAPEARSTIRRSDRSSS